MRLVDDHATPWPTNRGVAARRASRCRYVPREWVSLVRMCATGVGADKKRTKAESKHTRPRLWLQCGSLARTLRSGA